MNKQIYCEHNKTMRLIGGICSVLLALLVAALFLNVILRFGFSAGSVKLQDLQSYLFAIVCTLAIAFACFSNKHVRAGFKDNKQTSSQQKNTQIWFEAFLGLFSFILIFFYSLPSVVSSWHTLEGSAQPDGLGGFFLVRTSLVILCVLVCFVMIRNIISTKRGN